MFFLMCSERSGSNFIVKLLNGHSKICGPSTKHLINPVARNLFRYEPLCNEKNWDQLLEDIYNLLNVDFSIWKYQFEKVTLKRMATEGDIVGLIEKIYAAEVAINNKELCIIKENQLYEFLPFLLLNFPDSKYIYQVRDPRDMALSWKKNLSHKGGIVSAARQWKLDQQNSLKNYSELNKKGMAYLIKYEDLIEDTVDEIRKICSFLGVDYEEGILDFHKDKLTQRNSETQGAWNNLSKEVLSNNKNKYLKELTSEEIRIIEKICFYEMKHLNYAPINSELQLLDVDDDFINRFHVSEIESLEYKRPAGVEKNMVAKKVFYSHSHDK